MGSSAQGVSTGFFVFELLGPTGPSFPLVFLYQVSVLPRPLFGRCVRSDAEQVFHEIVGGESEVKDGFSFPAAFDGP